MYLTIDANYQSQNFGRHKWWKNISNKRFAFYNGTYKDTRQVIKDEVKKGKDVVQITKTSAENTDAAIVKDLNKADK